MVNVLIGPALSALRYAQQRAWPPEEYVIATAAPTLKGLDPTDITEIVLVNAAGLGRAFDAIHEEIECLTRLWPLKIITV